jgi:drug/metabolite transporter (DMT)-like permease
VNVVRIPTFLTILLSHIPFQVIRSTSPAAVALCSYLLENRILTIKQIASLLTLVGGAVMAVAGDTKDTQMLGITLCFLSVRCFIHFIFFSFPKRSKLPFHVLLWMAGYWRCAAVCVCKYYYEQGRAIIVA